MLGKVEAKLNSDFESYLMRIAKVASEVPMLQRRVGEVLELLQRKIRNAPGYVLRVLENYLKLYKPPDPPPKINVLKEVGEELEEYVESLKSYLNMLVKHIENVDRLESNVKILESCYTELGRWLHTLRGVKAKLEADIKRVMGLIEQFKRSLSFRDLPSALAQSEKLVDLAFKVIDECKAQFVKCVEKVERELQAAFRMYLQVRSNVILGEKSNVERVYCRLKEVEGKVREVKAKSCKAGVNIMDIMRDVESIVNELNKLLELKVENNERKVLKALDSYVVVKRATPLHYVVKRVCSETGLRPLQVLEALYNLSVKGIVKIKVKVE